MSGVYGEQLAFFPELMQSYDILIFDKATPGGLKNRRVAFSVDQAYLSRNKGGKEGIITNLRTENQESSFYLMNDDLPRGKIIQGMYVEDDGELYTFVKDNGFTREGNFHMYSLQLVTGVKEQPPLPSGSVTLGVGDYK